MFNPCPGDDYKDYRDRINKECAIQDRQKKIRRFKEKVIEISINSFMFVWCCIVSYIAVHFIIKFW